jgi:hypothetical protein
MKKILVLVAILALAAFPVLAGEWHTGQTNLCADCHTMHNSMAHTWTGSGVVSVGTPVKDGNWVKAANGDLAGDYLLKAADPNALCLSCHNGTVDFAPSVVALKSVNDAANRAAGYLNENGADAHTGHSLGSTASAPGFGAGVQAWTTAGLECIHCHTQHGRAGVYRNLGPRSGATVPTYAMAGKQPIDMLGLPETIADARTHATIDVFIDAPGYTPNSGNAFKNLYETDNVTYLKRTAPVSGIENASGTQCAYCHGAFHGSPTSANIGGEVLGTSGQHFNRHPVGGVIVGGTGQGGYSGNPTLRIGAAASVSKIKVYTDTADYSDATPGCISCHKGHGNGQPFGLVFANRTLPGMGENGNLPVPTDGTSLAVAQRGLCGQCHGQGN